MIKVNQIKLRLDHTEKDLEKEIRNQLKIKDDRKIEYYIAKKSIDARKGDIKYIYSVNVKINDEKTVLQKNSKNKNVIKYEQVRYIPVISGTQIEKSRPIIVGSGPAGLFCTYLLSYYGYRPLMIERGEPVEKRTETVKKFWQDNVLNTESNVQFGEGGAGTFSDGKLNTLVKDKFGRNRFVLETFVKFGAPEEILYINKPHIGTDILCNVVKNMREEIIRLGGDVRFGTCLTDIIICDGKVASIEINNDEILSCDTLILAPGHSSRDTFSMLEKRKVYMEAKAFAVGLRVQHPQTMINLSQYKEEHNRYLPAADYKVTANLSNGRGVYSFCMCPGGYVVNASSEADMIAVNGMSYSDRAGKNANSAIIVTVKPEDFSATGALAGVEFQRQLEANAFREGKGKIPVQLYKDFCNNKSSTCFGEVEPQIMGGYEFGNLRNIFPEYLSQSIIEGMGIFAGKLHGFDREDALFAGVESRTSSPLRIVRNDDYESNIGGLYPCGEGAGYAGGITSAAMDGIKVFDAIAAKIKPFS